MNPHVVCVCLTADRQRYTDRAVRCFLSQTYGNKSLLIWDTGQVPYELPTLSPEDSKIIGLARAERLPEDTIGRLRNHAIVFSKSVLQPDIIAHWDSDDWSYPGRVSSQVKILSHPCVELVGAYTMPIWDSVNSQAWEYRHPSLMYCLGTSMAYWRTTWEARKFDPTSRGEDSRFQKNRGVVTAADMTSKETGEFAMVAEIHAGNTCMKLPAKDRPPQDGTEWTRRPDWDQRLEALMRL